MLDKRFTFIGLALLYVLAAGVWLAWSLGKKQGDNLPQKPPQATITVQCPGFSAVEVEQLVAVVLERSSEAVEGIREVRSRSVDGMATIEITCDIGKDALALARHAAQGGAKDLPAGVSDPVVELFSSTFIAQVDVFGLSLDDLRPFAMQLLQNLSSTSGVAQVDAPGLQPDMPVIKGIMNREKAAAFGITPTAVADVLSSSLREGATAEEIDALTLPTLQGTVVPLRELVEFIETSEPPVRCRFNGRPSVTLSIEAEPGHDVKRVTHHIAEAVEAFRRENGQLSVQLTSY